ncbi:MAG: alpha/beta fold hydrolase [Geminicoccaceae bacterium]
MAFFEGFRLDVVAVAGGKLRLRYGGSGPPLLLLHGNPQTHVIWHAVAPQLAEKFTIICPDLRGYGQSFKPEATVDHGPYAKRAMAVDMIQLMDHFGFDRFSVGGHDRGARLAHRMALDFPKRITRLAVLDIIPTIEHFERTDMNFAMGYYHWFWLAQRHPVPESLINAAPDIWFRAHTSREPKGSDFFHPKALSDYLEAVQNPEMVRGMCEDYRAAASIDLDHDRQSREAGVKIRCPLLVLWGAKGKIERWYEPLDIWRQYCAAEISGGPVNSGHYLAEEAPAEVLDRFNRFYS